MKRKPIALLSAAILLLISQTAASVNADSTIAEIYVNIENITADISPYIFGVNSGVDLTSVTAGSFRLGGNRMSAYNWENNVSNAGSDYYNNSDYYLVQNIRDELKLAPGGAALNAFEAVTANNVPYSLLTLQMLGYVSSSKVGRLNEDKSAPSKYWNEVINRKDGAFSLEPDTTDNVVYMNEYLYYLINTIGNSDNGGFRAYALDNEPSLWSGTHKLVQIQHLKCSELIEKSVALASVIKEMDGNAEVFGPSLFGYSAFDSFAGASDWQKLEDDNGYRWFIDYYLDEMSKAEKENGSRLLDVLDLHFYTEAKGACGERSCNHYDNDDCIQARLDSVKALYDPDYVERSWITDTGAEFFPLLPNIQRSIDEYYPNTKIAFTEYNFGAGDHISGAVTQADMLGVFAQYGVYFASIWSFDENAYQLSAINMFTNYDGNGGRFADKLTECGSSDENIRVYASVDSESKDTVKLMLINKSIHDEKPITLNLTSENEYNKTDVYGLYGNSPEIKAMASAEITDNKLTYNLPALSVVEIIITTEKSELNLIPIVITSTAVLLIAIVTTVLIMKRRKKRNV